MTSRRLLCFSSQRVETVSLLLECHPELLSPYTAYGGAIYAHTPLHLASRNGHRFVIAILNSNSIAQTLHVPLLQGGGRDDPGEGVRHQRADVARHRSPRGRHLRKGASAPHPACSRNLFTHSIFLVKVDVVKVLLSGDIDLDLRDSGDKTVLDVMEDIKTPVSLEITDVIIGTSKVTQYKWGYIMSRSDERQRTCRPLQ